MAEPKQKPLIGGGTLICGLVFFAFLALLIGPLVAGLVVGGLLLVGLINAISRLPRS